eukprot:679027_1
MCRSYRIDDILGYFIRTSAPQLILSVFQSKFPDNIPGVERPTAKRLRPGVVEVIAEESCDLRRDIVVDGRRVDPVELGNAVHQFLSIRGRTCKDSQERHHHLELGVQIQNLKVGWSFRSNLSYTDCIATSAVCGGSISEAGAKTCTSQSNSLAVAA